MVRREEDLSPRQQKLGGRIERMIQDHLMRRDSDKLLPNGSDHGQRKEEKYERKDVLTEFLSLPCMGTCMVFLAAASNALSSLLVKELSSVDVLVVIFLRAVSALALAAPYMACRGVSPAPKGKIKLLLLRSLTFNFFLSATFYGFRYIPLGDVSTLTATQTAFVSLLACCFLQEPCGAAEAQIICVTIISVCMVTRPPFLFESHSSSATAVAAAAAANVTSAMGNSSSSTADPATYFFFVCLVLAGTAAQSVTFVVNRFMRDVDPLVMNAWDGAVGLPAALAIFAAVGLRSLPSLSNLPLVLLAGLFNIGVQFFMILALRVELAGTATVARRTLDILLAFSLQVCWFQHFPGTVPILGAVLITLTIIFESFRKPSKEEGDDLDD